jgi:hypothetical protein
MDLSYANIRKADNQVKFCFITAGQRYYEVRKAKREEEGEKPYCKLNTVVFTKADFKCRASRDNRQSNDAKMSKRSIQT